MKVRHIIFLILLCISVAACGGGGSSVTGTGPNTSTTSVTITGTAANGLIRNGNVKIYLMADNGNRVLLTTTTTDTSGSYTATILPQSGPVLVEVTGGTYVDEATGITVPVTTPVRAAVGSAASSPLLVAVTPLTELALRLAGTNPTATSIARSNALVTDLFNFDVISTLPVEPSISGFRDRTDKQIAYTLALAALSQKAKDLAGGSLDTVVETLRNDIAVSGRMSATAATTFKNEASLFLAGAQNQTGTSSLPPLVANTGTITYPVKIAVGGTFASSSFIKGIQMKLALPPGVTIPTDAPNTPLSGVIVPSGTAAIDSSKGAFFDPGTRTLNLALVNFDPGFGLGDVATINCDVAPGAAMSVSGFALSEIVAVGSGGVEITVSLSVNL